MKKSILLTTLLFTSPVLANTTSYVPSFSTLQDDVNFIKRNMENGIYTEQYRDYLNGAKKLITQKQLKNMSEGKNDVEQFSNTKSEDDLRKEYTAKAKSVFDKCTSVNPHIALPYFKSGNVNSKEICYVPIRLKADLENQVFFDVSKNYDYQVRWIFIPSPTYQKCDVGNTYCNPDKKVRDSTADIIISALKANSFQPISTFMNSQEYPINVKYEKGNVVDGLAGDVDLTVQYIKSFAEGNYSEYFLKSTGNVLLFDKNAIQSTHKGFRHAVVLKNTIAKTYPNDKALPIDSGFGITLNKDTQLSSNSLAEVFISKDENGKEWFGYVLGDEKYANLFATNFTSIKYNIRWVSADTVSLIYGNGGNKDGKPVSEQLEYEYRLMK